MRKRDQRCSYWFAFYTFYGDLREQIVELKSLSLEEITEEKKNTYIQAVENISNARKVKADNVVYMLELFGGKLSLTDVLDTEIPLLNQLREAKLRLIEEMAKDRNKGK